MSVASLSILNSGKPVLRYPKHEKRVEDRQERDTHGASLQSICGDSLEDAGAQKKWQQNCERGLAERSNRIGRKVFAVDARCPDATCHSKLGHGFSSRTQRSTVASARKTFHDSRNYKRHV